MLKRLKSLKINPLALGVIALLLFIPIYPKFPMFNVSGTYVAIRAEDFLVAFVLLLWLVNQIHQGFPTLKDRVGRLILLYWGVGLLSLLSAVFITKNIVPHLALFHFLRRIEYMSLFFVALASMKSMRNVKSYGWVLFLATLGVIVYGLGQKFFSWPVISTMNEEFSKGMLLQLSEWARINSTFAGHYDLAAFMVLILALTAGFFFGLKNKVKRILILLIGLASFYILILTASRVSFVAYLIAVTFTLVGLKKYWWVGPVLAFSLIGMLFSQEISQRYALTFNIDLSALSSKIQKRPQKEQIFLTPAPLPTPEEIVEEVEEVKRPTPKPIATAAAEVEEWKPTTELSVEYSSGIRFDVEWPRSLRAFAKNPFLGTGYSSVTLATDNDYLRLLAETGLLGFLAFFLIFLEIGRQVFRFARISQPGLKKSLVMALSGAALGLLANAVFIDVFESSKVAFIFWLLMGILVGMIKLKEENA
ncbi:hypothetical protein COT04_00655 [Candidatus Shapirobacteria bacterium CG07_land_8_20_14_0_80_39_12]|uniref:O-antigen ligase-related domain-containing protein n=2 Tax=Microgenomates group TaxID=1794810 RepID=A0A2M6YQA6_9BACT|nr:MAG: hypothetical protein COT04_00655 [Candidatus Shapirobacteria bacterium CG07_land_8_20_14_0_80_39_12]